MTQATDMLAAYQAAELAILTGKEYTLGERKLRLEDLAEIRKGRQEWEARVASEVAATPTSAAPATRIGGLRYKVADLSGQYNT